MKSVAIYGAGRETRTPKIQIRSLSEWEKGAKGKKK